MLGCWFCRVRNREGSLVFIFNMNEVSWVRLGGGWGSVDFGFDFILLYFVYFLVLFNYFR